MFVLLLGCIFLPCAAGRSSNCKQGFDGINCARENIAFRRPTNQSSDYRHEGVKHTSNLAVDGNIDTNFERDSCTHTDKYFTQAYWYVDLDHEVQSRDIQMVIYLRNTQGIRYKNFKILIDDLMCQEITDLATNATLPPRRNPVTITDCTTQLSGRRVKITADTGDLTLCEVQIWECIDGYFGRCDKKCNCYKTFEVCDKTTGACLISGCRNGTYGTDCQTECPDRRYGRNCSGTCGRCRNPESCNKRSGECSRGCEPGYRTPLCDTECPDRRYGRNCSGTCGRCRNSESCNKRSGECSRGCEPGYRTPTCDTECENGSYGYNCAERCGMCNNSDPCDKVNGTCPHGCLPGFWTITCHKGNLCYSMNTFSSNTEAPDVAVVTGFTRTDLRTMALSTTVGLLVVVIVILTAIIIRLKCLGRSSGKGSTGSNRDTLHINSSTTPAIYETFQLTEDNPYTSLQGGSNYLNT